MRASEKIFLLTLLLPVTRLQAQSVWDNINLASTEAKVLAIIPSRQNPKLIIQTFDTKEGKISVYLPPLSSSATISGTVYLEPTGKTEKEGSQNLIALQTYSLDLGDMNIPVQRGSFQLKLPVDAGTGIISLQLKNNTGQIVKNGQLPITTVPVSTTGFIIPPYAVSGDAAVITGSFDGNTTGTSVKINGEKAELLAESPSGLYFRSTDKYTGKVTVECNENGSTQTSASNILKLDLTADKTNLRRGQQTQLHIKLSGLEGLKVNVPVTIQNTSPSVITLEGGNTQQITITPGNDAPLGGFEISRNIQSLKNGSFSVSVNVIPFMTTGR